MTVHLCGTEQTLRSIVSLQGPSDAAAATAMWVGGEEREKMTSRMTLVSSSKELKLTLNRALMDLNLSLTKGN